MFFKNDADFRDNKGAQQYTNCISVFGQKINFLEVPRVTLNVLPLNRSHVEQP